MDSLILPSHGLRSPTALEWLFFDLNSFFASVEQQDKPYLRGKPVAVVPSMTDATCAIAASYEAKAFGIKTGTKIYEAKRLCPQLQCILARHDVYVAYHNRIFAEVGRHIPVSKICSIDEGACQLMTNEQSPEQATRIARSIKDGLRCNLGDHIKCSIGIASNIFLAKTATDMQKPDGLVILPPDNYQDRIFSLGLSDLCGIGRNIEHRLNRAGIRTIEQFWNLSPKHARKIWGSVVGEIFWYRLHGYDIPDKPTEKSVIGHSRVLDPNIRGMDKAYIMAQHLTIKVCTRLRRYNLFAGHFAMGVRTVDGAYWGDDTSFTPTQDNFTVISALEKLWCAMQRGIGRNTRLLKVSVNLYDLYEQEEVTLDLFDSFPEKTKTVKNTDLSRAMDALNKKFGSNTVYLGSMPKTSAGYVGTKIAFTRVPEMEEFKD
jgi:DNA polymerase-4